MYADFEMDAGPTYGLPREHDSAPLQDWEQLLGYLGALTRSTMPVVVSVRAADVEIVQMLGLLRGGVARPESETHTPAYAYSVSPTDRRDPRGPGGGFVLHEPLFEGGRLFTFDGDDYFALDFQMHAYSFHLQDINRY